MQTIEVRENTKLLNASSQQPLYLGTVWVSKGALEVLERNADYGVGRELRGVLNRHASGDHGDITDEQAHSLSDSVHSVYDEKLLVVTYIKEGSTYLTCA